MDNIITQVFTEQLGVNNFTWWLFLLAFMGGVLTSISPCSIGLLPVVIGYVGGYSDNKEKGLRNVIQIFFFIVGLSLVLTTIGVSCALTGKVFGAHAGPVWTLIMASFILVMGLNLLEIIHIPMPVILKKMPQNKGNNMILYPILIGGAFALASSPCSTPILAGIMAFASLKANITMGAIMLFLFSLGQGLILVIAGLFTSLFKKILKINAISGYFIKFSGILLVAAALIIYLKVFEVI
jgi:cytochrome c-type biogenesis protein